MCYIVNNVEQRLIKIITYNERFTDKRKLERD